MKVNILDAHDRKQHFITDQQQYIQQGIEDCLFKNPLSLALQDSSDYIYIFSHPRSGDESAVKRILWQPRLLRPKVQTNSMLFRVKSKTDLLEICWIIPPREMFGQYSKGKVTESDIVSWSINQFENHRQDLEQPFKDDVSEIKAKEIYLSLLKQQLSSKELAKGKLPVFL